VNAGFGCETEYEDAGRNKDAGYETDFKTDLGSDCASCFGVSRCNMVFLIKTVCGVLNNN
jgi:hypothetical protein